MKRSIIRLSLITIVLLLSSFIKPGKEIYNSTEGKLSVTFPAKYTTEVKETETYTTQKIQTVFENQVFFVTYNVHKNTVTDHTEMAQLSLDSFVESIEGKTIEQKEWKIQKHKGLKAIVMAPKNNLKIQYQVMLIGQLQYQIAVASESSSWNQKNADKFFKSFKLKY